MVLDGTAQPGNRITATAANGKLTFDIDAQTEREDEPVPAASASS
jgi:hypothetical protein